MKQSATIYMMFLAVVLVVALPPSRVAASTCNDYSFPEFTQFYTLAGAGISDATGYQLQVIATTGTVELFFQYWDGSAYVSEASLVEPSVPSSIYTFGHAQMRFSSADGDVTVRICSVDAPTATAIATATPEPPTATATATATPEVMVTATPVPPTPTPSPTTESLLADIKALQDTQMKWGLFAGTVVIGLLVLAFVRVR